MFVNTQQQQQALTYKYTRFILFSKLQYAI